MKIINRKLLKREAKDLIKGRVNDLFLPVLIIFVISITLDMLMKMSLSSLDYGWIVFSDKTQISIFEPTFNFAISFIMAPLYVGYIYYILHFIKGKKVNIQMIFSQYKNILPIFLVSIVVNILIFLGFAALIIPGIIISLMLAMTSFVLADNELDTKKVLLRSKELMDGYKWDYLVFNLSFLGWIILSFLTFGLLFIWVIPYAIVAQGLYYEKLKNLHQPSIKKPKTIKSKNLK